MTAPELDVPPFDIVAGDSVSWRGKNGGIRDAYFDRWVGRRAGHPLACIVKTAGGREIRLSAAELLPSNDGRTRRRRTEQGFPPVVQAAKGRAA